MDDTFVLPIIDDILVDLFSYEIIEPLIIIIIIVLIVNGIFEK